MKGDLKVDSPTLLILSSSSSSYFFSLLPVEVTLISTAMLFAAFNLQMRRG